MKDNDKSNTAMDLDVDAGYKEMLKTVNEFTSEMKKFATPEPQARYDLTSISEEQASMLCEKVAKCSAQLNSMMGRNQAAVYRMMAAVRSAGEAAIEKDPASKDKKFRDNRISRWRRICKIENGPENQKSSKPDPQKRRRY